jgi:hypothetical protein
LQVDHVDIMAKHFDFSSISEFFRSESPDFLSSLDPLIRTQTEKTTTVFSATAEEWSRYLESDRKDRRRHPLKMDIHIDAKKKVVIFEPKNTQSAQWATWLTTGIQLVQKALKGRKHATAVLHQFLFENPSNTNVRLQVRSTKELPTEATREIQFDDDLTPQDTDIVLQAGHLKAIEKHMLGLPSQPTQDAILGTLWPVLYEVIAHIGYSSYPRDRFKSRISKTADMSFLVIQLLFEGKKKGRLLPNQAGEHYLDYIAEKHGMKKKDLTTHDPYIRMLNEMSFVRREEQYQSFRGVVEVVVRSYLDQQYLRISLAGVMPGMMKWMMPMDYRWTGKRTIQSQTPKRGKYGILDEHDLDSWKRVSGPLADIGYIILRQLGIGQFGRVYEALNLANPAMPERVAVKVDRIRKGKKKEIIQAVETIMEISRGLSGSPHVIRIHDAGRLKPIGATYHILQLVDGDTLDNLIGVTGEEHSSILRPRVGRNPLQNLRDEYLKSRRSKGTEAWRKERWSLPFTASLSLSQALDLITSQLLWIEEVHALGFAVNDLKNGNIMLSRRGQLKAIDLDTYSLVSKPTDKVPDFFFLAITLLLFTLRILVGKKDDHIAAQGLLGDIKALRGMLTHIWDFGDVADISDGRVNTEEVIDWLATTMDDARSGVFANDPAVFTNRIDNLINIKRRLTQEEMILD